MQRDRKLGMDMIGLNSGRNQNTKVGLLRPSARLPHTIIRIGLENIW